MILCTADLHLSDLPRDQYRHDWMRNILPSLLRKHQAELLIVAGDFSDDKDHLSSWLVNQTVDHFSELTKICPTILLRGNHDYVEADNPFYEFLDKIPGLTWINTPTSASLIPSAEILGDALFLPHTNFYKQEWGLHTGWEHDLYLTHQTYAGASIGPRKLDGILPSIFPKGALVISGDIHVPQEFNQVVYTGSPYTCDFGDAFDPRVLLLDPKTLKYKSIPSPGPQKRLLEFTYPSSPTGLALANAPTKAAAGKANPGDIVKIRIDIEPAQTPQWQSIKDEVRKWAENHEYNVYLIQPKVNSAGTKSMSKRRVGSKSDTELLETYAGARAVSEATLATGKRLMEKA
jgi:DNA repair exonuclease SbcCD nuclease subunit